MGNSMEIKYSEVLNDIRLNFDSKIELSLNETFGGKNNPVNDFCVLPGNRIAACLRDKTIRIFLKSLNCVRSIKYDDSEFCHIFYFESKKQIITIADQNNSNLKLYVWDFLSNPNNEKPLKIIDVGKPKPQAKYSFGIVGPPCEWRITQLFSPNEIACSSGSCFGYIYRISFQNFESTDWYQSEPVVKKIYEYPESIRSICVLKTENSFVFDEDYGIVKIKCGLKRFDKRHYKRISSLCSLALSGSFPETEHQNKEIIISVSEKKEVILWSLDGKVLKLLDFSRHLESEYIYLFPVSQNSLLIFGTEKSYAVRNTEEQVVFKLNLSKKNVCSLYSSRSFLSDGMFIPHPPVTKVKWLNEKKRNHIVLMKELNSICVFSYKKDKDVEDDIFRLARKVQVTKDQVSCGPMNLLGCKRGDILMVIEEKENKWLWCQKRNSKACGFLHYSNCIDYRGYHEVVEEDIKKKILSDFNKEKELELIRKEKEVRKIVMIEIEEKEMEEQKKKEIEKQKRREEEKGKLHAFVVGQNIGGASPLYYPWSDGLRMCSRLKEMGFAVTRLLFKEKEPKLTYSSFRKNFIVFCSKLKEGDKVVVYFSGHGYQEYGKNYLYCIKNKEELETEDMKLSFLIEKLRQKNTINFFFLDCCQIDSDNNTWKGEGEEGESLPFSKFKVEGGQFVFGYACLPGQSTIERGGGVFTDSLLKFLSKEEEIHKILRDSNSVMLEKYGRQGSVFSTALQDLYL